MDPWGHEIVQVFKDRLKGGLDVRPTIAITKAHMQLAEIETMVQKGELKVDKHVVLNNLGQVI
jgi:hypothetical protein